ncbi:MAG: hypothetical protein EPN97_12930 [Alphaproteobacteria bacterium]|nr:MAG: hypothetical protein EPN97_12930 [Alphaproteobacteria bacterium]
MSSEDVTRMLKLLEKIGYESKSKEFAQTLDKFKAHPEALKALRKGVARQGREEDSGSYCEDSSHGYADWYRKNEMLEKLDLEDDRAFLENVDPATLMDGRKKNGGDATLRDLREQVKELTGRVDLLEKRAIRGPTIAPKGPAGI